MRFQGGCAGASSVRSTASKLKLSALPLLLSVPLESNNYGLLQSCRNMLQPPGASKSKREGRGVQGRRMHALSCVCGRSLRPPQRESDVPGARHVPPLPKCCVLFRGGTARPARRDLRSQPKWNEPPEHREAVCSFLALRSILISSSSLSAQIRAVLLVLHPCSQKASQGGRASKNREKGTSLQD